MRLILSRKGFDSSAGGCPSPVFPDGSMLSLPIPDKRSPVRYCDITWRGRDVGDLVEKLTGGRQRRDFCAHLDPDLRQDAVDRICGWRASLGQVGAAQGHLRAQGVGVGDLFLFFGLFRRVDADLAWTGRPFHAIWGWMSVGDVAPVDVRVRGRRGWTWAQTHPHLVFDADPGNTLYVAAERMDCDRATLRGAGVFGTFADDLRLTAQDASPTNWDLPFAFLPRGRRPLSYHGDAARWSRKGGRARLRAVAKGQEFVLDLDAYPEVREWAMTLIRRTQ